MAARLASEIEDTEDVAKELKSAILKIFPGLDALNEDMKIRSSMEDRWVEARFKKYGTRDEVPIYTWAGREYFCEPPRIVDGKVWSFVYKMINVLIQGSAADIIKVAMVNCWARLREERMETRLVLQIHDELLFEGPPEEMEAFSTCATANNESVASASFTIAR